MDIKKIIRIQPVAIIFSIALLAVSALLLFFYFISGTLVLIYTNYLQKVPLYPTLLFACAVVSIFVVVLALFQSEKIPPATIRSEARSKYLPIHSFFSKYKQQSLLFFLVIFAVTLMIIYFAKINLGEFSNELGDKDKPFYIRNIALLLAAIGTAIFTWWKNALNQKTIEVSESTRQDELFAQAVGLLERTKDLTTRKAGVHILKDLAMTSPRHTQKCIDMLCSLNEFWMPKILNSFPNFFELNPNFSHIKDPDRIIIKKIENVHFACDDPYFKNYMDDISLSQLVINTLPQILSHISKSISFDSEFSLSHSYLCSINIRSFDFHKFRDNLSNVYLINASLRHSNFIGANLHEASLDSADLSYSDLTGARLSFSNLACTNISDAKLTNATLNGANICDAELSDSELSSAKLIRAELIRAHLLRTNLINANLTLANLTDSKFSGANLSKANLTRANLSNADFTNAILVGANFTKANLSNADFTNAILTGADFTNTNLTNTIFNGNFPSPDGQPPK